MQRAEVHTWAFTLYPNAWSTCMLSSGNLALHPLSVSFSSLVAVVSPGVVQNKHPCRRSQTIKCISQIPDDNRPCQSMRSTLGVRRWLNCPIPPTPPSPLIHCCSSVTSSLLDYWANSPHLFSTAATLIHVTEHRPGPGYRKTHQLLVTHTCTHTHILKVDQKA